eukprot:8939149-Karenia_brevis.AAC.1
MDDMQKVLVNAVKLNLSLSQQMREVRAACMWQVKVLSDNAYVVKAKAATVSYNTMYKQLKEETNPEEAKKKLGGPHIFAFNAMVGVLMEELPLPVKAPIQKVVSGWTPQMVMAELPHLRVKDMFKEKFKRVEIACPGVLLVKEPMSMTVPTEESMITVPLVVKTLQKRLESSDQAASLLGSAPPGDLERKLQEFLDSMK